MSNTVNATFFSIIIPTYNRSGSILKAINSILTQSYQSFEIIVIDDASTDNTKDLLATIEDKRLSYYLNAENKERCISRNLGIEKAQGKYICFLDSDDYHLPNHLEELHTFIHTKSAPEALFFVNAWNETEEGLRTERFCPNFSKYNPYAYFLHYTVNPQRWAIHRSILEKVNFDPDVVICEDMDTSLRILASGYPVYQLQARTTVYVQALDSFSLSDHRKVEKELFYLKRIFAKKELKSKLPKLETNRLLSMCYYFLSVKAFENKKRLLVISNALKSFLLYPKSYNGKTNKSLLIMSIYAIPLFGDALKILIRLKK